jgi:[ribosomal protein S5]-alanine N-acetyltransferase
VSVITQTPRLLIRELELRDAPELHSVFSLPEATRFAVRIHSAVDETRQWISAVRGGYDTHGFGPWAVVRRDTMDRIGYCGCGVIVLDGARTHEIGYRILPACWRQGFATEAVRAALDVMIARWALPRIVALIQPANAASIRVAEKAGMRCCRETTYEGRAMLVYEANPTARARPSSRPLLVTAP